MQQQQSSSSVVPRTPRTPKGSVKFAEGAQPRRLEEDEIDELRGAFTLFDEDSDGTLARDELSTVLLSLGRDVSQEDVDKIFASADEDGSGSICFDEFLNVMARYVPPAGSDVELQEAYNVIFDKRKRGVSVDDLEQAALSLAVDLNPRQLEVMMAAADQDRDGLVSLAEFKRIWAG